MRARRRGMVAVHGLVRLEMVIMRKEIKIVHFESMCVVDIVVLV